jgi:rare lipoprotein A
MKRYGIISFLIWLPLTILGEGLSASHYSSIFTGKKTASGEKYHPSQMTAAHKTLPLGSMIKVINLENQKSVVVKINDRMKKSCKHDIDLSHMAARKIGVLKTGMAKVRLVNLRQ